MDQKYKYDVAISYESDSRKLVKEVVEYLKVEGFEIFFDEDRKMELLSENLKTKLYQIYQNESLIKVLFVTEEYMQSPYTLLESRSALRSIKDNFRRLIVINFLGANIQDEFKPYVYLKGDTDTDEIAYLICERVKELKDLTKGNGPERDTLFHEPNNVNIIGTNQGIIAGDNVQLSHIHFN